MVRSAVDDAWVVAPGAVAEPEEDDPARADEVRRVGEALLRRLPEMLERITGLVRGLIPAYGAIPQALLHEGIEEVWRSAITGAFVERRQPLPRELEMTAVLVEAQAAQGIPLDAFIVGITISSESLWPEIEAIARALTVQPETLLELRVRSERWNNALLRHAVERHHGAVIAAAREDERRRIAFLQELLHGSIAREDVRARAIELGLDPTRPYRAIRATASSMHELRQLEQDALSAAAAFREGALCAIVEGELVGIVENARFADDRDVVIGLGPSVPLDAASESYHLAARAHDTARTYGLIGLHEFDTLSVRLAIVAEPDLTAMFRRRYVEPLHRHGEFGAQLEETLRTYVAEGLHVENTARALHLHPNTIRHRLRRYGDITGADIGRAETLVEVWWALHAPESVSA